MWRHSYLNIQAQYKNHSKLLGFIYGETAM